jgi:hypothetical protein
MDDRRHNFGHRQIARLVPPKEDVVATELEAFAKWLLAHRADIELASTVIHTEARAIMQKLGVTSIEESCHAIKDGDFDYLWMNMADDDIINRHPTLGDNAKGYNMLIKDIGHRIIDKGVRQTLSRDEMGVILSYLVGNIRIEPGKITSLLRQHGIEVKQVRHKGRKVYGIHVIYRISDEVRAELEEVLAGKPRLRRMK